ncbi:MAG: lipoyl synthase [Armatimonadota bacterium]
MNSQRPEWIRAKAPQGENYTEVKRLVESAKLHTVCQSANCPNIGECWRERTATFMILGNTCTRSCRFCAVNHGVPDPVDQDEPRRVADAVKYLNLRHAVITSVTRDDLSDGGARIFAEVIRMTHESSNDCTVEVLIPDLQGDENSLAVVLDARPEILNHNIETVERCYPSVRPQAIYSRSIDVLRRAKQMAPSVRTKSGIMVGAGEEWEEIILTMRDLHDAGCDILTIGQYLAPSAGHVPITKYYTPEEFAELKRVGLDMGIGYVESGPLVRSSYHAAKQI